MNFASQEFAANGTAALALVAALIQHLVNDGTLTPKDVQDIISAATTIAPQGHGRMDKEARAILESMRAK